MSPLYSILIYVCVNPLQDPCASQRPSEVLVHDPCLGLYRSMSHVLCKTWVSCESVSQDNSTGPRSVDPFQSLFARSTSRASFVGAMSVVPL